MVQPASVPELVGYQFRGVEVDLLRGCLRVDGAELPVTPLLLKLLALLCEKNGELCTRDQIFDAVWPRQEVSDDALSKLISRLRELLGVHADAVVTVRKQGLRLDAAVMRQLRSEPAVVPVAVLALASASDVAAAPAIVVEPASVQPRSWTRVGLAGAAVLVVVLGLGLGLALWPRHRAGAARGSEAVIFAGYALRESDLRSASAETATMLHSIEQAMDGGDGALARRLLRSLELSDDRSVVLPALRAIEHSSDDPEAVEALLQRARSRLSASDSPYVHLLVAYAAAGEQGLEQERAAVDALLTLRPQAWRLQLARAHLDIQASNPDGALRHLRAIDVAVAPAQTLMFVLADRVSYGDADAVRQLLADGALRQAPLQRAYVLARLAWNARAPETGALLQALADQAESDGAAVVAAHARELAAAYAYASADPLAEALLRRAAFGLRETGRAELAAPLLALAADVAFTAGRKADAKLLLEQALQSSGPAGVRVELEIANARLGLLPRGAFLETAGGTDDRFGRGEPALIAGWHAFMAGARNQAIGALAEARAGGIERSPHAESAAWLGVQLGEAAHDCWVDPPYPDLLRMAPCKRSAAAAAVPARSGP